MVILLVKKKKSHNNNLWSIFCTLEVQMIQAEAFRYLLTMEHFRALYFITWETFTFKAFCQGVVMFSSDCNALIRHSFRVWGGGEGWHLFFPLCEWWLIQTRQVRWLLWSMIDVCRSLWLSAPICRNMYFALNSKGEPALSEEAWFSSNDASVWAFKVIFLSEKGACISVLMSYSSQETPSARTSVGGSAMVSFFSQGPKTSKLANNLSVALHMGSSRLVFAKGLQKKQHPWLEVRQQKLLREDPGPVLSSKVILNIEPRPICNESNQGAVVISHQ